MHDDIQNFRATSAGKSDYFALLLVFGVPGLGGVVNLSGSIGGKDLLRFSNLIFSIELI